MPIVRRSTPPTSRSTANARIARAATGSTRIAPMTASSRSCLADTATEYEMPTTSGCQTTQP
jgi:hypothetical protein